MAMRPPIASRCGERCAAWARWSAVSAMARAGLGGLRGANGPRLALSRQASSRGLGLDDLHFMSPKKIRTFESQKTLKQKQRRAISGIVWPVGAMATWPR